MGSMHPAALLVVFGCLCYGFYSLVQVTSLRHETIRLVDPFARSLVPLCDGTRDRAALLAAMGRGDDATARAQLDDTLSMLAQCALLER